MQHVRRGLQTPAPSDAPPVCGLVANFIARQGIILAAGLIFLGFTAVRVKYGYEKRNLKTFCADCSKQAGQQMCGGLMMVALGLLLAESGLSPLAWYGAEYPFEIVLTTCFTGLFRKWAEAGAVWLGRRTRWRWLNPFKMVGQYGPKENDFRCNWYWAQLFQAIFLIGVPARVCSLLLIYASLQLPHGFVVHAIASGWFDSGLTCEQQTVLILYVIPLTGDAVQFIIVDKLQAFGVLTHEGSARAFENLEEGATECDSCLSHRRGLMSGVGEEANEGRSTPLNTAIAPQ